MGWERKNWWGGKGPGQIRVVSKAMRTEDIRWGKKETSDGRFSKAIEEAAKGSTWSAQWLFFCHTFVFCSLEKFCTIHRNSLSSFERFLQVCENGSSGDCKLHYLRQPFVFLRRIRLPDMWPCSYLGHICVFWATGVAGQQCSLNMKRVRTAIPWKKRKTRETGKRFKSSLIA